MRSRAQTSSSCENLDSEQPQFLREQYQKTKLQLSILVQKNESLQKQIDILKQGNTHLLSQFLFNKHREELNRVYRQLAEKTKENSELKQIILQLENMVKSASQSVHVESKLLKKFESIKKFSIKLENDKQITVDKESSIGHQLKVKLKELLENYQKLTKGQNVFNVQNKYKDKTKENEQNANIVQLEQKLQKNSIEISHLKEQVKLSKINQQKQMLHGKELENQKQKCKQLEKELQQRVINFQKSIKNYEKIIDEMRKMSIVGTQGRKVESQKLNRSRSRQSSVTKHSPFLSPSQSSLLFTLRQQITILQSTIATQNERYNILENSNKELRQRLMKMIENEEKLRKQLLQERIKNRTNRSISQSSKYSHTASVRKINFVGEINNRYQDHNNTQNQKKIQELKTNAIQSQSLLKNANSQSYIYPYKTLAQISNREFKSQSIIAAQKEGKGNQMKLFRQRRFDRKELQTKKKPNQMEYGINQQYCKASIGNVQQYNRKGSSKYFYQPPRIQNRSNNKLSSSPNSHYSKISQSQPQSDSKQISFQISESQSNLSKGDKIIQFLQMNENSRQDSPHGNSFSDNYYGLIYSDSKKEQTFVGKFSNLYVINKEGNNIVMNSETQNESNSNGVIRFTRKQ